jgi:hypothetical protein
MGPDIHCSASYMKCNRQNSGFVGWLLVAADCAIIKCKGPHAQPGGALSDCGRPSQDFCNGVVDYRESFPSTAAVRQGRLARCITKSTQS